MASDEQRIRELVESITLANGTNAMIGLAKELNELVKARKKRHKPSLPDPENHPPSKGSV